MFNSTEARHEGFWWVGIARNAAFSTVWMQAYKFSTLPFCREPCVLMFSAGFFGCIHNLKLTLQDMILQDFVGHFIFHIFHFLFFSKIDDAYLTRKEMNGK